MTESAKTNDVARLFISDASRRHTKVCEKNTPPEKRTLGKFSLQNTKSGAGEQLLLLGYVAKARAKGVLFHRHRYV